MRAALLMQAIVACLVAGQKELCMCERWREALLKHRVTGRLWL